MALTTRRKKKTGRRRNGAYKNEETSLATVTALLPLLL
jgi:hypothetical protein